MFIDPPYNTGNAFTHYDDGHSIWLGLMRDRLEIIRRLLATDRWGNLVINPEYDAAMLSAAMCKLEGFSYAPSEVLWWQQGRSSESDFI